ncbi:MAG: hypothetical protein K2L80_00550 [Muribaculaceae bacterium]|nr:hypothetical protein [Muribaculaceae bacterium]MDE6331070.1 hypothetical protein [Muribaculaceae bacterium]
MKLKHNLTFAIAVATAFSLNARQPHSGYRGFIDWSNNIRSDKYDNWPVRQTAYYTGVTTSHGYQINPMFFAGAGIGAEYCSNYSEFIVPVFVQGRADFSFGAFTPFADIRLGANLSSGTGVYFSPSVGYRFNWGRKVGVNVSLGMTLAGYKCELYDVTVTPDGYWSLAYIGSEHRSRPYFSFRLGFDF